MATLLYNGRERFVDGDYVERRVWRNEAGQEVGISCVYVRATSPIATRIYGLDAAHGPLHEHHGDFVVPLDMAPRQALLHFDRVVKRLRRWLNANKPGSD